MKYFVSAYGYECGNDSKKFDTEKEAIKNLDSKVKKWCKEQDINIEDSDYCEGDKFFSHGMEDLGVCIYEVHEVPEFNNEFEKLIWEAKYEMDQAEYTATDYMWCLQENCVDVHTIIAKNLLDNAMDLYKEGKI